MAAPAFLLCLTLALAGAAAATAEDDRHRPAVPVLSFTGHGPADDKISVGVETHDAGAAAGSPSRATATCSRRPRRWQSFPGHGHLFPASAPLPFGDSYDDLIGGRANLPGMPLGREAMKRAARVLSAYDPATATDHQPLKRALAALKVMLSEAARLQPIHETVGRGWETESRVAPEHLPYIEHWDTMSYEILRVNRTGSKWEDGPFTDMLDKSANIRSMEEALAMVKVLLITMQTARARDVRLPLVFARRDKRD